MDWASAIGGFVAGLAGGYSLKSVVVYFSTRNTISATSDSRMGNVNQRGNTVGGSMSGRDINNK